MADLKIQSAADQQDLKVMFLGNKYKLNIHLQITKVSSGFSGRVAAKKEEKQGEKSEVAKL